MDNIFYIFIFSFGLIVGSFLNCVIYRLAASERRASPSETGRERGEGFISGRSYCPHCRHKLGFFDLIPVLSFILLRGRCRYCHKKISRQYPIVELAAGILFALSATYYINNAMALLMQWVIICFLIVIFVYDLKHYIIPDKVVFPAIIAVFLFRIFNFEFISDLGFRISDFSTIANQLLAAFLASGFFLIIVLISKGKWMGVGDIKLAFLMGLILGFPNIVVALFLAFLSGAIIGVGLIFSGKKTIKSEVPFGPFLVGGTFVALFWGPKIINWYVKSFYIN